MALPAEVDAVMRAGHVLSAVVWVGFVLFMAFVRPRAVTGLSEGATREFMPRLAKAILPWMMWSAILTFVFGGIVFWSLSDAVGFENIGITLHIAVALAVVMFLVGMVVVYPTGRKAARVLEGGPPPKPVDLQRLGKATLFNAWLGVTIVILMVLHGRLHL